VRSGKGRAEILQSVGQGAGLKKRNKELKICVADVCPGRQGKNIQQAPVVDYILGPQNIHMITDLPFKKAV